MKHAGQIVAELALYGIRLVLDGDRICFFTNGSVPPPELIGEAKAQKEVLHGLLAEPVATYAKTTVALREGCPAYVNEARWRQCVADADFFLGRWGVAAEALGWMQAELFGLHKPPDNPRPNYGRLSRYDCTGLIWLLDGRPVVALTAETAAIQTRSGGILTYRKYNKPALGPVGDSLDDFDRAA